MKPEAAMVSEEARILVRTWAMVVPSLSVFCLGWFVEAIIVMKKG
jgi:hypothetical protein